LEEEEEDKVGRRRRRKGNIGSLVSVILSDVIILKFFL
jgi:hypothetical protein